MNPMNLHPIPEEVIKTLEMWTTCTMYYNHPKHSMNYIESRRQGKSMITSNKVTWTFKRHQHATQVTKRKFSQGVCSRIFEMFSRKQKFIIFLKKLRDLVASLPNHRNFCASSNPLRPQPMHCTPKGTSSLQSIQAYCYKYGENLACKSYLTIYLHTLVCGLCTIYNYKCTMDACMTFPPCFLLLGKI